MGPATLVLATSADPVLVAAVSALLSGGGISAIVASKRAKSGAQLDVLSAAKVIYDELREQVEELREDLDDIRARNAGLLEERDVLLNEKHELEREVGRLTTRICELERRLEALTQSK